MKKAVDEVMEKFGRPRANSLHRRRERERRNSLPAWEEEDNEGNLSPYLEDRPRALSLFGDASGIRFSGTVGGEDRGRSVSLPDAPSTLGEDLPPAVDDWRMQGSFEVGVWYRDTAVEGIRVGVGGFRVATRVITASRLHCCALRRSIIVVGNSTEGKTEDEFSLIENLGLMVA